LADVNDRLIDWWRRRRWTTPRYPNLTYVPSRSDLPELPRRRTVVVVGNPARPKWVVFACPCGHAHAIAVNLSPARRPSWRLEVAGGRASLRPSVDCVSGGRRCHFWLRDGRVQWAQDADSQDILPSGPAEHERGDSRHGA
jgi:hypothetical protein